MILTHLKLNLVLLVVMAAGINLASSRQVICESGQPGALVD